MQFILAAFLSAILFGASTPIGKMLLETLTPFQLAGLLYLGAAIGVLPFSFLGRNSLSMARLDRKNTCRLAFAIGFGGVLGPVLLLVGLEKGSGASVSMWLNLELVATAVLGYFVFRDHLGRFGWLGVAGTLFACILLSWKEGAIGFTALLFVTGACICWAFDNHLTALIDTITPSQSTFWKGLVAGCLNLVIALMVEPYPKSIPVILSALMVGIFAYGFSISLYITAAQNLGTTRSQMIFASAPFFGVALSALVLGETISLIQMAAALILALSLVTLFLDRHSHVHAHDPVRHKHRHHHEDDHHNHRHPGKKEKIPHGHWHRHKKVFHAHPHWPDIHHRHDALPLNTTSAKK
ncbi:MAG: DMT family transporter [Proteobacteria bacterium]|nr:DMT family transporter [Pseudomonadota bacterium]MBU1582604.1 DMT family transporter [Pseudomonadota bacterium]MBU2452320.1 DMT family transporter [Pseudomonadota bacterium]